MKYDVHIRDTVTGETVVSEYSIKNSKPAFDEYGLFQDDSWWSNGNMSCDCNRSIEFDRARGKLKDMDDDDNYRCTKYKDGHQRYYVDKIVCDGREYRGVEND